MDGDVRVCICHFTPEQYTKTRSHNGDRDVYDIKWDARPNPSKSVQVPLTPTTRGPLERTVARAAVAVGMPDDSFIVNSLPMPVAHPLVSCTCRVLGTYIALHASSIVCSVGGYPQTVASRKDCRGWSESS